VNASSRDRRTTVVIVNYRAYAELEACLASVERGITAVDTVVVDQQSDAIAAARIAARFPHVTIIPLECNTGFAAGINRGAREASTSYLLLLNPDCVMEPDLCAWLPDWLDAHPEVGAAAPRLHNEDGTIQASARRFPDVTTAVAGRSSWLTRVLPNNRLSRRNLPGRDLHGSDPIDVDWVSGACMMVRKAAFDSIGGMDEGFFLYWEDADFCRRLGEAGWKTVYHPTAGAVHAGGRSSRHANDASVRAFHRSAFRLFWRHATPAERLLAPIVFTGLEARSLLMRLRARYHVAPVPASSAAAEARKS
jgi:GT2 family glycosyltransferase